MCRSTKVALLALAAAFAALMQTGVTSMSHAAEPLRVEGGAIADAAPDARGIRTFKGSTARRAVTSSCRRDVGSGVK